MVDKLSGHAAHVEAVLETVGDAIITVDAAQRILLANTEAERIFGYPPEGLYDTPLTALMPEKYRSRHNTGFRAAAESSEVRSSTQYLELEGLRADGTVFPLELRFTTVEVDGERFFTAAARDITERKSAEAEISRLNEALASERDYLREEVRAQTGSFADIITESPALEMVLAQLDAVAKTDATVLILGESGVGKELVARSIHERSPRAAKPLVKVNCASVPRELFESEFFGHKKGAFTGAQEDRVGRFQLANGGTLFLDEVGEIPIELQSKLLRVLQEKEFERVGDDQTRTVDVRVVAATNRDLLEEAKEGRFREDLYYRLGVFPLEVPPLRDRPEDVMPLVRHFLIRSAKQLNTRPPRVPQDVETLLTRYAWPGNIRELQNVVERAAILAAGNSIHVEMLGLSSAKTRPKKVRQRSGNEVLTRAQIEEVLVAHDYIIKYAAEELGLSRQALYRRMEKLGIPKTKP